MHVVIQCSFLSLPPIWKIFSGDVIFDPSGRGMGMGRGVIFDPSGKTAVRIALGSSSSVVVNKV